MTVERLKERVMEIIKDVFYINEDGGIEIYTDYRDRELSSKHNGKSFSISVHS